MLRHRLIPVLLLKNGLLVRSELFNLHQIIGNPLYEVQRFNDWNVDELIYLDITREGEYDIRRDDHKTKEMGGPLDILESVSKTCFMPLTWGGRIRTLDDMRIRFARGADKITLNTAAVENPGLVTEGARAFGNQAMVVSMDVKKTGNSYEVFTTAVRKRPVSNRSLGRAKPNAWARAKSCCRASTAMGQAKDTTWN